MRNCASIIATGKVVCQATAEVPETFKLEKTVVTLNYCFVIVHVPLSDSCMCMECAQLYCPVMVLPETVPVNVPHIWLSGNIICMFMVFPLIIPDMAAPECEQFIVPETQVYVPLTDEPFCVNVMVIVDSPPLTCVLDNLPVHVPEISAAAGVVGALEVMLIMLFVVPPPHP